VSVDKVLAQLQKPVHSSRMRMDAGAELGIA